MLLIDFVIIISMERILINSEIAKGNLMISALKENFLFYFNELNYMENTADAFDKSCDGILNQSGYSYAVIVNKNLNQLYMYSYFFSPAKEEEYTELKKEVNRLISHTVQSGKKNIGYSGTTWGVFWKQERFLILSVPLSDEKKDTTAGIAVALSLENLYDSLKRIQAVLFIYIFINLIILTFIGLNRISKITVRPLHKLLKRAEEYKEEMEIFFPDERGSNEFHQLSKALNRMLSRISDDREKLRQTVSSLEKANTDLKQAQKDIIRAEKLASVGRLAAGIAHEIGNPIAIVIGYLDLLKGKDLTEDEKAEFILRAGNEISRINLIIRQLLDYSRPSDGEIKAVSVHEIIRDIAQVIKFQPIMSDIDINLELSAPDDIAEADPNQLKQVFLNLLINSADAISSSENTSPGRITVETQIISESNDELPDDKPILKIMFGDNGPGIPEENLEYIFDPFYTTKEPGKGTGLGLWVSFMIIETMGGKLKAVSEIGKGTTMIIYLPLLKS